MGSENKYKARGPKETISIIEGIFHELSDKFSITVTGERGERERIYSCSIALAYDGNIIMMQNGKGMTREYSLASAYSELYERFSNEIASDGTLYPFKGGVGREASYEEAAQSTPFFKTYMREAQLLAESYYPKRNMVAFKNLIDCSQKEFCPQHIYLELGTTGMAAGNTLEEALVQGISEICERVIQSEAIFGRVSFCEVDDSLLEKEAPEVYERTQEIRKKGMQVKYYDASQSTGFPVMMSLWINKKLGICAATFGAFPVFEIACERCLTETLQGKDLDSICMFDSIAPHTKFGHDEYDRFLKLQSGILDENLFLGCPVIDKVNSYVYTDKNYGNRELLAHFRGLFSEKSIDIYYRDTSLVSEMASVQIFAPNFCAIPEKYEFLKEDLFISRKDYDDAFLLAEKIKSGMMDTASMLHFERNGVRSSVEHFFPTAFADRNAFGGALYDYIAAVYAIKFKEYGRAASLLFGVSDVFEGKINVSRYAISASDPDFELLAEINKLRLFAEYMDLYKERSNRDEIVSRIMGLWGYSPQELPFDTGTQYLEHYVLELTCGRIYRKRIMKFEEIGGIITRAKEKYRGEKLWNAMNTYQIS